MLNDWFTGRYALARQELEARLTRAPDPLLIRAGPELIYWHRGQRRSATLTVPAYDEAKAISHLPPAILLTLRASIDVALSEQELRFLRELEAEVRDTRADAKGGGAAMLAICHAFVEEVIADESVSTRAMAAFARQATEPMGELIRTGSRAYLEALHDAVSTWTKGWERESWESLLVVICAGHAPRYKESTRQYFQRLLGERSGEGARGEAQVLYAEGAESEDEAIRLAAEHLLNRELGCFFMKSPLALQEDVLGDAARAVLDDLF